MGEQITADDIVFVELPPRARAGRPGLIAPDVPEKLRANPGQWARLATLQRTTFLPTDIKRGKRGFGPPGAFEATTRRQPDRTVHIYARYVGD